MAPCTNVAGLKRKAAALSNGSGSNPKSQKVDLVRVALTSDEYEDCQRLPASVREMLADATQEVLKNDPLSRHPFQDKVLGMIEEALTDIHKGLDSQLSEKQDALDTTNSARDPLDAARTEAKEALEARRGEETARWEAKEEALKLRDERQAAKAAAEEARKAVESAREEILAEKEQAAKVLEGFRTLETNAPEKPSERKKLMAPVDQLLRKQNVEECLLEALPAALKVAPDARSEFDKMCMEKAEQAFTQHALELEPKLAENKEREQQAEQEQAKVAAEFEEAEAGLAKAEEAIEAAGQEKAKAQAALAETQACVRKHDKEAKQTVQAAKGARTRLEIFEMVEEAFRSLEDPATFAAAAAKKMELAEEIQDAAADATMEELEQEPVA